MNDNRLFSQACENNKYAISDVLASVFTEPGCIIEIGSGSGQHAAHIASMLPHVNWQPTDTGETLASVEAYRQESDLVNIKPALLMNVLDRSWPMSTAEGVFSANTAHIMSWPEVKAMFTGVANLLNAGNSFCLYGPFNYDGKFTSEGNIRLDAWARSINPESGIRDFKRICEFASQCGLVLLQDHSMPANNRLLQFVKQEQ